MCSYQKEHGQESGNELGNDGRICSTGNAHMKDDDEQQIENDVEDAGQNEKHQGTTGIANGAQNATADVVNEKTGNAEKVNGKISGGRGKNIIRRRHEAKHRANPQNPDDREENTQNKGHGKRGFDGRMKFFEAFSTKMVADNNPCADGKPIEKEDQHIDDDSRRANGSEGFLADKITNDNGVHSVVQHLKDVSKHQREGKEENLLSNWSNGHIPCGRSSLGMKRHMDSCFHYFRGR